VLNEVCKRGDAKCAFDGESLSRPDHHSRLEAQALLFNPKIRQQPQQELIAFSFLHPVYLPTMEVQLEVGRLLCRCVLHWVSFRFVTKILEMVRAIIVFFAVLAAWRFELLVHQESVELATVYPHN
jgi:hypothetical protein